MDQSKTENTIARKCVDWLISLQWWGKGLVALGLLMLVFSVGSLFEGGPAEFINVTSSNSLVTTETGTTISGTVSNLGNGALLINNEVTEVLESGEFRKLVTLNEGKNRIHMETEVNTIF